VAFAAVNYVDIARRSGSYTHGQTPPFVPGVEAAGTVVALGEGVSGLHLGQRVATLTRTGAYAELVAAPAAFTFGLPDRVGWEQAAAFPTVSLTGYHLLATAARLQPRESVLVNAAAGGVGTTVTQIARILEAGLVLGAVGSAEKARYARAFGADHVLEYSAPDFSARVRELTGGRGVDVVLDGVGGEPRRQGQEALAPFGRLIHFGNTSGEPEAFISPLFLRPRNLSSIGFSLDSLRDERPALAQDSAKLLLGWLAEQRLRIDVTRIFPLDEAAAAHRHVESRGSVGKILLRVDGSP
jgi:NADPH:quinone reductase